MTDSRLWSISVLLGVLMLVAAACGSPDEPSGLLPPNAGDSPPAAAACRVDEPNCNDTRGLPDEGSGSTLPGGTTGGAVVNGGLTVSEALSTDATGVLAVQGYLFEDGAGMRLCEELSPDGDRFACRGANVFVEGLDVNEYASTLVHLEGTTYSSESVIVFAQLVDGTLVVNPMASG